MYNENGDVPDWSIKGRRVEKEFGVHGNVSDNNGEKWEGRDVKVERKVTTNVPVNRPGCDLMDLT